jgi:hypothetical protein
LVRELIDIQCGIGHHKAIVEVEVEANVPAADSGVKIQRGRKWFALDAMIAVRSRETR